VLAAAAPKGYSGGKKLEKEVNQRGEQEREHGGPGNVPANIPIEEE
jgi:hypothetical protein